MRYRSFVPLAALMTFAANEARGQSLLDASARAGVQYVSYRLRGTVNERIDELAIPLVFNVPVRNRLALDLAGAYAVSTVTVGDSTSELRGFTDSQLRANYTFGSDAVILTAGLNLPTGQATVGDAGLAAAGRIGNDFLAFPISNMGTGFGGTAGLAVARAAGAWSLGAGASVRHTVEYEPYRQGEIRVRFQPGDEYRVRLGADRSAGSGRLAIGFTYSAFGRDAAGSFTFNTGDRYVGQVAYAGVLGGADLLVSSWNLLRAVGETLDGRPLPWENITNLSMGLGFSAGALRLEPNVELRAATRDGDGGSLLSARSGRMVSFGLRSRVDVLGLSLSPSGGISTGRYLAPGTTASAELSGWRVALTGRVAR